MSTTMSSDDRSNTFSCNFTGQNRNALRKFILYSEDLKKDIVDHNMISDMTLQLYKHNAADIGITIGAQFDVHPCRHHVVVTMIEEICRDINLFFYS